MGTLPILAVHPGKTGLSCSAQGGKAHPSGRKRPKNEPVPGWERLLEAKPQGGDCASNLAYYWRKKNWGL